MECNWFRHILPQFLQVGWMDFGKELPCEHILCRFEWADSLEFRVVGQLKGQMVLDLLESHLLKRPSDLEYSKFKEWHKLILDVKYCYLLSGFLVKGADRLVLFRFMGATHDAIGKILKWVRKTGSPNQRLFDHRQKVATPREDQFVLRVVCINWFQPSPRLRARLIHHTGRHLTWCLLAVGYHSSRLTRCHRLILVYRWRRCQWVRH